MKLRKNHPMQPLVWDNDGVVRFKQNKIVRMLLDKSQEKGFGFNELARLTYNNPEYNDDWNQFAQLLGYSIDGFNDLSYADPKIVQKAYKTKKKMRSEKEK